VKHSQTKVDSALALYDRGLSCSAVARHIGVARQTVRRWVLPGERERHNQVVAAWRRVKNPYLRQRVVADSEHERRIAAHRARILREEVAA
jgi:transposase